MELSNIKKLKFSLWDLKNFNSLKFEELSILRKLKKKKLIKIKQCLCGRKKFLFLKKIKSIKYYRCRCKNVIMNPVLNHNDLNEFYKKDGIYHTIRDLSFFKEKKKLELRRLINLRKAKQLSSLLKYKGSSILDYGFGNPGFLEACKKYSFRNLYGFDININKTINKKNLFLSNNLDDFKKKKFDAVTLWGVIEHLNNPKYALSQIDNLVKSGGYIVIEAPSSESILSIFTFDLGFYANRYLEPYRHIFFFSLHSLKSFFKSMNYKLVYIETNGLDLQTVIGNTKAEMTKKIINIQEFVDKNMLGDHYRVFFRKL
jgi:2-polyprenyl-3-methyl-5-hydroxy-6-metoxy-1,4-benzoquinol methylase